MHDPWPPSEPLSRGCSQQHLLRQSGHVTERSKLRFLHLEDTWHHIQGFTNFTVSYFAEKCHAVKCVQKSRSVTPWTWASAEIFPGGGKDDILLIFFSLLAMQRKRTNTKKKMSNVTATVAYSVFLVGKLHREQMFQWSWIFWDWVSGVRNE